MPGCCAVADAPATPPRLPRRGAAGRLLQTALALYQQLISPLAPPSCRFYPTCSQYARQALRSHGAALGTCLALRRILRCHPFHRGGYDPVPAPRPPAPRAPRARQFDH